MSAPKIAEEHRAAVRERALAAFVILRSERVKARGNYKCCGNCSSSDLGSRIARERKQGKIWEGYAYWHRQDDDGLLEHGSFYIGFGDESRPKESAKRREKRMVALAGKITEVLEGEGLRTYWTGDTGTRIRVDGLESELRGSAPMLGDEPVPGWEDLRAMIAEAAMEPGSEPPERGGWAVAWTGGNCRALRFERPDGSYLLATDDAQIPTDPESMMIGLYDQKGEGATCWDITKRGARPQREC